MKKVIVLNHKSQLELKDIKNYLLDINDILRTDQTNIICPSNIYMPYFNGKYNFYLGSQDVSSENINGEITGNLLKSVGVKYTLIGHPDRINALEEKPKMINEKIKNALKNNITPIVVLGETFYNFELKKTGDIISKQIKEYLSKVEVEKDIILAYIPNWEFKGKQIPKLEHIKEVIDLIKNIIKRKYSVNIKVLYGGNITPETIEHIAKIPNVDGYIIDTASANLSQLKQILNTIE